MARKGNYEEKIKPKFALIRSWKRNDLTDIEICDKLGIKKSAFYNYKNKYPEFKEILDHDKELTDAEVEDNALDNAKGFLYEEEQVFTEKEIFYNDDGKKIKEITKPKIITVTKRKLSDQQAVQWWLKNRKPETWKDKRELDVGNTDGQPFKLEDVI